MSPLMSKGKAIDKLSPTPRIVSKAQDVGKSGFTNRSSLTAEDPMNNFNKQPRRWLHIDADGHVSYVTVCNCFHAEAHWQLQYSCSRPFQTCQKANEGMCCRSTSIDWCTSSTFRTVISGAVLLSLVAFCTLVCSTCSRRAPKRHPDDALVQDSGPHGCNSLPLRSACPREGTRCKS